MYEMEGALRGLPFQAGRFAWLHRLRRADCQGQTPASGSGFPAPSASPESPPGSAPVSDVKAFLLLQPGAAQALGGTNFGFFHYPQNGGGYPQLTEVIHQLVHNISTGHQEGVSVPVRGSRAVRQYSRPAGSASTIQSRNTDTTRAPAAVCGTVRR